MTGLPASTWSVSWFRAYDLGTLGQLPPREVLDLACGDRFTPLDADQHAFYDIQTLRRGHVARAKSIPVRVAGDLLLPGGTQAFQARVQVHLVLHSSGFMVVRPTLHSHDFESDKSDVDTLIQLERAFWRYDYPLRWSLPGSEHPTPGGVRNLMNWVFLDIDARGRGRVGADPVGWAQETIQGCDRLHTMAADGDLHYPFPVSFGTQFEILTSDRAEHTGAEPRWEPDSWAQRLLYPDDPHFLVSPVDLGAAPANHRWYLGENQALTITGDATPSTELDAIDADRTQLLEFLTLRRATLRCVQRDTQRVLTERLTVSRRQVGHWQFAVASTTDDYVLHDRIGRLLQPVRRHNTTDLRIRDLAELESQVRSNLAWFQQRIDTLSQWTGGLVGAAVGAAAMVLSLQEAVKSLMVSVTGTPSEQLLDQHGAPFAAIMFILMCATFTFALLCIRWVTARLRPFSWGRTRALRRRRRRAPGGSGPSSEAVAEPAEPEPELTAADR